MDQQNTPPQQAVNTTPPVTPPTQTTPMAAPMGEEHKSSVGPIVGSIIVVLVIVLGGLYLYGSKMGNNVNTPQNTTSEKTPEEIISENDANAENLSKQGSTDDLAEIEADLNATNLDNLDSETTNVEGELKAQ